MPESISTQSADRTEDGILFLWHPIEQLWCSNTPERSIFVIPPKPPHYGPWKVGTLVPRHMDEIEGEDARERAFAVAALHAKRAAA
jgi:hypothetical protein